MHSVKAHVMAFLAVSAAWGHGVVAESAPAGEDAWLPGPVAILPFANHSEDSEATVAVLAAVHEELEARGISYVSSEELRGVLRQNRIRAIGRISSEDAAIISREVGATAFLLGSIDIFVTEGVPEVGVSLRLLDVQSRMVSRAASVAATGRDYVSLFDGARVLDVDSVLNDVVARVFDRLEIARSEAARDEAGQPVVVIPFDDADEQGVAGEVVTNVLVSALVERGYRVVEPGISRSIALRDADLANGSADHPLLDALHSELGPVLVVTGTVESFQASNGLVSQRVPQVEINARVIDARSHHVMMGLTIERSGNDTETLFQLGRCHSVGEVAGRAVTSLVERIDGQGDREHDR